MNLLEVESLLVSLALVLAATAPRLGSKFFSKIDGRFAALARRRVTSVLLCGLVALFLRLALLPVEPIPEPVVHDEFGYLLAADTFAHGRLTNPTHPLWKHFESFNIIQKPTYQSYPQPAQGLVLAAGTVLLGNPFWGVWLSAGVLCAAICWMLQAWMPARWALLGGMLCVLRFGVFGYWASSYWGGALGATGGALVIGALPRIKRRRRVRDALLLAFGLALLANTRPYEGFVFSVPILVALAAWVVKQTSSTFPCLLRRLILPAGLVLTLAALSMGYYFWRVTGSPFRMPYSVERQTYAIAPYFLWQPLRPRPVYNDFAMERMYAGEEMTGYRFFRSPVGMLAKLYWSWSFYLGPVLTLPILMLPFILPYGFSWRDIHRNTRFLLLVLGLSVIALEVECFYAPHYPAPNTSVLVALVLFGMRKLQRWRCWGKTSGLFLLRVLPAICMIMFVLRAAAGPLHIPLDAYYAPAWYQGGPHSFGRDRVAQELAAIPGRHLVIVRYEPDHEPFEEWVYNDADIDNSKVVWARELSPRENDALIRYFAGRQIWLLEADEKPPKLEPFDVH